MERQESLDFGVERGLMIIRPVRMSFAVNFYVAHFTAGAPERALHLARLLHRNYTIEITMQQQHRNTNAACLQGWRACFQAHAIRPRVSYAATNVVRFFLSPLANDVASLIY